MPSCRRYWTLLAQLRRPGAEASFAAELTRIDGEKAHRLRGGAPARGSAARRAFSVSKVTRSQQKKNAPPPFTTSTLQQEASRKLSFGARRTMSVAQSLYEGIALPEGQVGLITYMRTDSVAMASGAIGEARQVVGERYGAEFVPERPNAAPALAAPRRRMRRSGRRASRGPPSRCRATSSRTSCGCTT